MKDNRKAGIGTNRVVLYKNTIINIALAVVTILTIVRLLAAFFYGGLTDHDFFYHSSVHFYDGELFHEVDPGQAYKLPAFPGLSFVFQPFTLFNITTSGAVFFLTSVASGIYILYFFLKNALPTQRRYAKYFIMCFVIFFNSSPVLLALRNGQVSFLFFYFLILAMFFPNKVARGIFLCLCALLKYSLIPFYGLYLLAKKEYVACLFAFISFTVIAIGFPLIHNHSLVEVYSKYFMEIYDALTNDGFDSFSVYGVNIINLDFFKFKAVSTILKIMSTLFFLYVLKNEVRSKTIHLAPLFFITSFTLSISYHRLYDAIFTVAILMGIFFIAFLKKEKINAWISALFLTLFFVPSSVVYKLLETPIFSEHLGYFMYVTPEYGHDVAIVPFYAILQTLVLAYSVYYYLTKRNENSLSIRGV